MIRAWLTTKPADASHVGVIRCLQWWPLLALGGCVTVKAPDKPIEINLNISVRQEVVVSLKKDADDFIASNPELFPK